MRSKRRGHGGAGVAGRDHGRRLPVAHQLSGPHQGGILLAADASGRVLVHSDDLGAGHELEAAGVAHLFGRADQDDADAVLFEGPLGTLDDLAGRLVAAHGVDGDGQGGQRLGRRTLAPAAQVSRPRPPGDPCTSRSWGTRRAGSWQFWQCGHTLRAGRDSRQAPAWWDRPFALDFFFFGTAMTGLQKRLGGARR